MRVALFTDSFDQINGVSNTYHYLARFCRDSGISLDIYTHGNGRCRVEASGSVRVLRFRPKIPVRYYTGMEFDLFPPCSEVLQECRRADYDLIQAATPGSMGLCALRVAEGQKSPLVGCHHTALPEFIRPRLERLLRSLELPRYWLGTGCETLIWRFLNWFYVHCHLLLAPSEFARRDLQERLGREAKLFSRGVDTEKFHPQERVSSQVVTALYVSRGSVEKNLDRLVSLFRNRPGVRLKVVGDGPFRKRMQAELSNACFEGFLTGQALSEVYASADFFVFPSTNDTFGNVVLEAMA